MNRDFEDLSGRDPYEILGVRPEATPEQITRAYRQLVRRAHPDTGGTHDEQSSLNLARDILLDPQRRRAYEDRWSGADVEEIPEEPYFDPYEWSTGAGPSTAASPLVDEPPPRPAFRVRPEQTPYFPPPHYPPANPWLSAPQRHGWNALAIVAFVLSFCVPPAGFILSLIALSQTRRTRERGGALAGLALAISTVTVACCVGWGLFATISTSYRTPFLIHSATASPAPSKR